MPNELWTAADVIGKKDAEIARLTAELTALRAGQDALVAAAYEAAAKVFDGKHRALREIDLLPHDKPSSFSEIAAIIRALTPADATAALDAMLLAERNKARRESCDMLMRRPVPPDDVSTVIACRDAILAMIETEGNNDR